MDIIEQIIFRNVHKYSILENAVKPYERIPFELVKNKMKLFENLVAINSIGIFYNASAFYEDRIGNVTLCWDLVFKHSCCTKYMFNAVTDSREKRSMLEDIVRKILPKCQLDYFEMENTYFKKMLLELKIIEIHSDNTVSYHYEDDLFYEIMKIYDVLRFLKKDECYEEILCNLRTFKYISVLPILSKFYEQSD